jgi:hypothetical protein
VRSSRCSYDVGGFPAGVITRLTIPATQREAVMRLLETKIGGRTKLTKLFLVPNHLPCRAIVAKFGWVVLNLRCETASQLARTTVPATLATIYCQSWWQGRSVGDFEVVQQEIDGRFAYSAATGPQLTVSAHGSQGDEPHLARIRRPSNLSNRTLAQS